MNERGDVAKQALTSLKKDLEDLGLDPAEMDDRNRRRAAAATPAAAAPSTPNAEVKPLAIVHFAAAACSA